MTHLDSARLGAESASTFCDRRFPDHPRWYLGEPRDARMRLPDALVKSVAFVGVNLGNEVRYGGTAFIVAIPYTSTTERHSFCLVTARHVIAALEPHGDLCVRFNCVDGGARLYSVQNQWIPHPDPAVDLVALPTALPAEVDIHPFDPSAFVTDTKIVHLGIGIGDEIAMVGLFHQREGYNRNIPIMRSGIIAAMPDEPLLDKQGRSYDGYLLEVRSIGGLSGSPVFLILPSDRPLVHALGKRVVPYGMHLLGIVRGHWNQSGMVSLNEKPSFLDVEQFNAGIAVITPMQQVAELLEVEDMVKHREQEEAGFLAQRAPIEDSALSNEPETEYARFEELTRKLVNVSKKTLDEKRTDES